MEEGYKIDKTDDGFILKRLYIKTDNTQGIIKVAEFTNIVEFNNFVENSTTNRLNEFLKFHNLNK